MSKFSKFFEDVLKVFATLSVVLLVAGYVDLKTYYQHFGINISGYINTSEIILASLDNLGIVIFSLVFQLIIWLSLFGYLFDYTKDDIDKHWEGKRRPQEFSDDLTIIRFVRSRKIRIFMLIIFILAIISSTLRVIFQNSLFILQGSYFILINFFLFVIIYFMGIHITRFIWLRIKKQREYNSKLVVTFLFFLPVLMLTIWIKNNFLANRLRKYGNREKIELLLNNDIKISINDSTLYLGRTENYFFFWNKRDGNTITYPREQVKRISSHIRYP